ncbi:MAG: hypothetical protein ABEJ83_00300 [Candidatus Nanohaloarchaea archaeon]
MSGAENLGYSEEGLEAFGESWSRMEEQLEQDVEQTADEYNLDTGFQDYRIGELPEGAIAATAEVPKKLGINRIDSFHDFLQNYDSIQPGKDGNLYGVKVLDTETEFIADPAYFQMDEDTQELVETHEIMHDLQKNGLWGDELYNAGYTEDEHLRNYLNRIGEDAPEWLMEGTTEAVTERIVPNGRELGQGVYPREQKLAEQVAYQNGVDLAELEPNIDGSVEMGAKTAPPTPTAGTAVSTGENSYSIV